MRRVVGKRVRPAREEDVVEVECALGCGAKGEPYGRDGQVDWHGTQGRVAQTTMCIAEGQSWPEGGHIDREFIDVCPECTRTKVFPWLVAQGATIEKNEVDF